MAPRLTALLIACTAFLAISCAEGDVDTDVCVLKIGDANSTSSSVSSSIGLDTDNYDEVAQSFKLTTTTAVSNVRVRLLRTGNPVGSIGVFIDADAGGPSRSPLLSATIDIGTSSNYNIDTSGNTYYTATFSGTQQSLTAGTTYWVRLRSSVMPSATDAISWVGDDSASYADGYATRESNSGAGWTLTPGGTNRDFFVKIGCQ